MSEHAPCDRASALTQRVTLDIRNLTMMFGGLRAVSDFDMTVPTGGLYGLIGPNGAGKTTVFNMITGLYVPTERADLCTGSRSSGGPAAAHDHADWASRAPFRTSACFKNLTRAGQCAHRLSHPRGL